MKKILSILLTAVMLLSALTVLAVPTAAATVKNTFNENDESPKISTAEDFEKFYVMCTSQGMTFQGKTVTLENDIVFNETTDGWQNAANVKKLEATMQNAGYFSGTFDGKGHTIEGVYIDKASGHSWHVGSDGFVGLFPQTRNAILKNFTLDGFYISGDNAHAAGAVVGHLSRGSELSNIVVKNGTVKIANTPEAANGVFLGVGAIIGYANMNDATHVDGTANSVFSQTIKVENCVVEDSVEVVTDGVAPAGGIIGRVYANTNVSALVLDLTASKIQPKNSSELNPIGMFTYGGVKYEYKVVNRSTDFEEIIEVASPEGNDLTDFTNDFNTKILANDCYGGEYVEPAKFTVTWSVNGVSTTEDYYVGVTPSYKGDLNVTSETHIYTFTGWDNNIVPVAADITYTAQYDVDRKIKITWMVDNTPIVEYYREGEMPSFKGSTVKADDDYNVYSFTGWDKNITAAVEEKTYIAQYDIKAKYRITWVIDGTQTQEICLEGIKPAYKGKVTKAEDATNKYKFIGWDKEIVAANGDAVYTAQFEAIPKDPNAAAVSTDANGGGEKKKGCKGAIGAGFAVVVAVGMAGAFVARKKED